MKLTTLQSQALKNAIYTQIEILSKKGTDGDGKKELKALKQILKKWGLK